MKRGPFSNQRTLICPPFLRDEGRISRDQDTEHGRRKLVNDDMVSTLSTLDLRVDHIYMVIYNPIDPNPAVAARKSGRFSIFF